MKRYASIAVVAAALVLAIVAPGNAQGTAGHGPGGEHRGEADGRHDGGRHDHDGDRDHRPGEWRGPVTYWNYYPYYASTPGYWYYCPSAEAYYPYVTYCLDAWVPVLAR